MSQQPFIQNGEFKGSVEQDEDTKCRHKNAKTTGKTCREGCCDEYECPDCGVTFMVECPD